MSYVWEGESGSVEISLNGQPRHITTNLALALRRLRKKHEHRTLWIDALSIDQSNDVEKSHQVGLMGEIYRRCVRVYLWMGDYCNGLDCSLDTRIVEETSELLLGNNRGICRESHQDKGFAAFSVIHDLAEGRHLNELSCCMGAVPNLGPFEELIQKPWWDRIWIVQEIALPPDAIVIYGPMQMP